MKALFFTSSTVDSLYRNWLHVCQGFGPLRSLLCRDGFAVPWIVS